MTDILSPSPYSYLDALTPSERQAEIARRQHASREDWCDDARRARDYQARNAELEAALFMIRDNLERAFASSDFRWDDVLEANEMAKIVLRK